MNAQRMRMRYLQRPDVKAYFDRLDQMTDDQREDFFAIPENAVNKQMYEMIKNSPRIMEQMRGHVVAGAKITCRCGSVVKKKGYSAHLLTMKHKNHKSKRY